MLNVTARENEKHIEVNLSGALTLREVAEAWQRLETLYHQPKVLILNLAEVTDLDTMGFQMLLYLKSRARADGRKVHYARHSAAVLGALDLFGAVAEFGDKIHLTTADRQRFAFKYGLKAHRG